ncbi:type 2 lanthipeptide synthetase LanM family protein [Pseudaminobacter soli (ex Li et al. 2025)]|nr:type 2 lanthipeptide synthetase LanM family protein [Mesorhizobium soli]
MDGFFDRLVFRAATIDELLSDAFIPTPGQKSDTDIAARRLAAWCKSCASGDWSLFGRRLERDGLTFSSVLERFATVRTASEAIIPDWIEDSVWIDAALQDLDPDLSDLWSPREPVAFQELLMPLVRQSNIRLASKLGDGPMADLGPTARSDLTYDLVRKLSDIFAGALYERFDNFRKDAVAAKSAIGGRADKTLHYAQFSSMMRDGGFRHLFEERPVLLRLAATITRQWIDTTSAFIDRLSTDFPMIREAILNKVGTARVASVEGDLSDPHNGGYSVKIVRFDDGSRIVYKPKDLRVDSSWHKLVTTLNTGQPPLELKAARVIVREGYGWTEFIDHVGCLDEHGCRLYFRRAGALLSLLHLVAATDMHEENIIASGEHPVPIDLEMLLQASAIDHKTEGQHAEAFEAALEVIANSVMMVGLLPTFGRAPDHSIFDMGGLISNWNSSVKLVWSDINSDAMVPRERAVGRLSDTNLPHVDGRYSEFGDNVAEFISGFGDYYEFLSLQGEAIGRGVLLDAFAELPIRKIIRPTGFYQMLLHRLKDHQSMEDGAIWSAQADFVARLADWEAGADIWPLQSAERAALLALNIPYFQTLTDNCDIRSVGKNAILYEGISGLSRARKRMSAFDQNEIDWQIEVIRQNTATLKGAERPPASTAQTAIIAEILSSDATPSAELFLEEASRIASDLERHAIRIGPSATWIGLDWMGDSDVAQLLPLGEDLFDGLAGVSLFLAAYSKATESKKAAELAMAAIARARKSLKGRNAARIARSLGLGGANGLGSIVYGFAVIAALLNDKSLLSDALSAAELFTDDLIEADRQLDIIGGSAGGILGLLRLYRDTSTSDVLARAIKCGEHLLERHRRDGKGIWLSQGNGDIALPGMSHGAAGFAYAFSSLAAASGRTEFADAAVECMAFENRSFAFANSNWPDLGAGVASKNPQGWAHGLAGIGIARAAMLRKSGLDHRFLATEVEAALEGIERTAATSSDTLCSGSLGVVEFLHEASIALGRDELNAAAKRLMGSVVEDARSRGDYLWRAGKRPFNVGLFRGLSGLGYTLLRQIDPSLPNVLVWE